MAKLAVVFWTGTGNTEAMADAVVAGATAAGAEAEAVSVDQFNVADVVNYSAFAFGCPSMGDEELEEDEFKPMWDEVKEQLGQTPVGLFGSWGWGDGAWMETWKEEAQGLGLNLKGTAICEGAPDDSAIAELEALGAALVSE